MREIEVGCAIVEKRGKILIAQRKPESFLGGCWEFPGGKREAGETFEDCVVRELAEEVGIVIRPRQFLRAETYQYPEKTVHLSFYLCDWVSGEAQTLDCQDVRWIFPEELPIFQFPDGDQALIRDLIAKKNLYFNL